MCIGEELIGPYASSKLSEFFLVVEYKGRSPFKKTVKKRGHCPYGAGGGQPQFLF